MTNTTKWYTSSTGKGVSLTLKGTIVALIPLILIITKTANLNIGQEELNLLAENLDQAIIAITSAISAVMVVYGGIRKIINKIVNK